MTKKDINRIAPQCHPHAHTIGINDSRNVIYWHFFGIIWIVFLLWFQYHGMELRFCALFELVYPVHETQIGQRHHKVCYRRCETIQPPHTHAHTDLRVNTGMQLKHYTDTVVTIVNRLLTSIIKHFITPGSDGHTISFALCRYSTLVVSLSLSSYASHSLCL